MSDDSKMPEDKEYQCSECDFKSSAKSASTAKRSLRRHIKTVHDKIKDHKCSMCEFAATDKRVLTKHVKKQHGIDKKDKEVPANTQENVQDQGDHITETTCQMCGFKSSKISELSRHYYVHFPVPGMNMQN